ncbi:MAG: hypothetical protein MJ124_09860 [Lachnospiraceae bacterium]|nr:hypothetical protein [Lachnospiraceae bacterium]
MKKIRTQMNQAVETVLNGLKGSIKLEKMETGEFESITIKGMKFSPDHYKAEGIGHVSVMKLDAGIMGMVTMVLAPFDKNLPLISLDYIYLPFAIKAYTEVYGLSVENEVLPGELEKFKAIAKKYEHLKEAKRNSAWYDELVDSGLYKQGIKNDVLLKLTDEMVKQFVASAEAMPALTAEQKKEKIAKIKSYSDGLVDKGGIATDQFKAALGEDKTRQFLDDILFGTRHA